ncbi:MAG: LON peptidase substrate-binding domain-containing protein [Acidimicrobiia bacterium]|nr:LON peptidase substrate-binding domain-containing protein [Acidimicrobiia bacterium]
MKEQRRMRMFPLSSVMFPRGVMPLHVFEPRYLAMINEAIDDDGVFGVVLIERGWEVGGGDTRFTVGTAGRIVSAGVLEDERMAVVAVGTDRFDVVEWLEEDPYPVALVSDRTEASSGLGVDADEVELAFRSWRRVAGLASELGADVGTADLKLPDDPRDALWVLASVSPLEQIDRQRLLEEDDPLVRVAMLRRGLDEQAEVLEARLAGGLT